MSQCEIKYFIDFVHTVIYLPMDNSILKCLQTLKVLH